MYARAVPKYFRGVSPILISEEIDTDNVFEHAVDAAQRTGYVKQGELAVDHSGGSSGRFRNNKPD